MSEPDASRPYMPGYGIAGPAEGRGLLPWSWAEKRLAESYRYWVISTGGRPWPHAMPVWGVWHGSCFWFSTGGRSRKTHNLRIEPRCTVHTDTVDPVVIEGTATVAPAGDRLEEALARYNAKYPMEPPDLAENPVFVVTPRWVFGLVEAEFTASPTRWLFES
jgi:nitroimidazol reductase NimA-like FMN-containing flavoprotein (pyridoxamine 5'-phosphate oxidase superfamily)